MPKPFLVIHRRNRSNQLALLPRACWVEVDIDVQEGIPCLSHDPVKGHTAEKLANFLIEALKQGIAGFVFDCKRENAEKLVEPLLLKHNIKNYFYLNEMEVQADIFLVEDSRHKTAIRIWQYRRAAEIIRYVEEMKAAQGGFPAWAWLDCWRRGLKENIADAVIPLDQAEAAKLQQLGVRLCVCSPELYVHEYDKKYTPGALGSMYQGIVDYRQKFIKSGIEPNAVCTRFPALWSLEIQMLMEAGEGLGNLDLSATSTVTEQDVRQFKR